jgi:hypothetical protein
MATTRRRSRSLLSLAIVSVLVSLVVNYIVLKLSNLFCFCLS